VATTQDAARDEAEPPAHATTTTSNNGTDKPLDSDLQLQLDSLSSQLDSLTEQISTAGTEDPTVEARDSSSEESILDNPELVHKTVACWLEDDRFSKAEEVELLRALFS
jgi:hypothetical protein